MTYKDVFGGEGSFAAQVNHQVKAALQAHRARTASGKLFWVSTAAQNPWPAVGSTSVERQMVAEHLVQAVGTGLWDGLLDLMQLTTGRLSEASLAAAAASALPLPLLPPLLLPPRLLLPAELPYSHDHLFRPVQKLSLQGIDLQHTQSGALTIICVD